MPFTTVHLNDLIISISLVSDQWSDHISAVPEHNNYSKNLLDG